MGLCRRGIVIGFMVLCVPLAAPALGPEREASPKRFPVDGVAAYVNEHTVTIGDVMAVLQSLQELLMRRFEGEELKNEKRKALSSLIEKYLILDFAQKKEMALPDWIVDERVDTIVHDLFKGDRTELLAVLSKEGLTYAEWEEEIKNQIIVSLMLSSNIDRNVRVPPSAVRKEYERNADEYEVPGEVKLRMIVLKEDSESGSRLQKAEEIRKRLDAGEDFAELARTLSEGEHAAQGGDWGWVGHGELRPELTHAAEQLGVNEVSEVIETDDEAYIVKVEDRREARAATFDEVREKIELKLRRDEAERLYRSWIERLREHAYVRVLEEKSF